MVQHIHHTSELRQCGTGALIERDFNMIFIKFPASFFFCRAHCKNRAPAHGVQGDTNGDRIQSRIYHTKWVKAVGTATPTAKKKEKQRRQKKQTLADDCLRMIQPKLRTWFLLVSIWAVRGACVYPGIEVKK